MKTQTTTSQTTTTHNVPPNPGNTMLVSAQEQRLLEKLRTHPELNKQIAAMIEEVTNESMALKTADQAEEALATRVDELARLALQEWARNTAAQHDLQMPAQGARRGGKKN